LTSSRGGDLGSPIFLASPPRAPRFCKAWAHSPSQRALVTWTRIRRGTIHQLKSLLAALVEGSWSPQTEGLGARIQSLEARTEPDGFRSVRVRKTRGPFDRSARLARPPHYRKPDVPPGGYRRIDNERKRTLSERFDSPRSPEVDTSLIMDWLVVRILPTPPRIHTRTRFSGD
jgi:hypothetical protein